MSQACRDEHLTILVAKSIARNDSDSINDSLCTLEEEIFRENCDSFCIYCPQQLPTPEIVSYFSRTYITNKK